MMRSAFLSAALAFSGVVAQCSNDTNSTGNGTNCTEEEEEVSTTSTTTTPVVTSTSTEQPQTTPVVVVTTPEPVKTTPEPEKTTPEPEKTTPEPEETTPAVSTLRYEVSADISGVSCSITPEQAKKSKVVEAVFRDPVVKLAQQKAGSNTITGDISSVKVTTGAGCDDRRQRRRLAATGTVAFAVTVELRFPAALVAKVAVVNAAFADPKTQKLLSSKIVEASSSPSVIAMIKNDPRFDEASFGLANVGVKDLDAKPTTAAPSPASTTSASVGMQLPALAATLLAVVSGLAL